MQRKILALAVASAFAVPGAAYAQVTISGALRFSVDRLNINDSAGTTPTTAGVSKWQGSGHSANIKFQSRESLGGGMTAWGVIESGVADSRKSGQSDQFNGRNSGIGLDSTSWGTVMMGLWDSPYKQMDGFWNIGTTSAYSWGPGGAIFGRGDSTGSMPNPNCISADGAFPSFPGLTTTIVGTAATTTVTPGTTAPSTGCQAVPGSATAFQRRLSNTFQYWSPVWSGVQFLIATQMNEEKVNPNAGAVTASPGGAKADPKMWSMGLRWAGANAAAFLAYENHKNFNLGSGTAATTATAANGTSANRESKDKGLKIGGNYNFGPVQVSLAAERLQFQTGQIGSASDLKDRSTAIAAMIPVGNGAIRTSYARSKVTGTNGAASDGNGKLFNVSYEYNLSKRSQVYIAYAKLTQNSSRLVNFGGQFVGSAGTATLLSGQDPKLWSFGMNHNF